MGALLLRRLAVIAVVVTAVITTLAGTTPSGADSGGASANLTNAYCSNSKMVLEWSASNTSNPDVVLVEMKYNGKTVSSASVNSGQTTAGKYAVTAKPFEMFTLDFWINGQLYSTHQYAAKNCKNPTFTLQKPMKLSGVFKVGHTVRVSNGVWSPKPTSFTYQWYCSRNGGNSTPIPGASKNKYKIQPSVRGCEIWATAIPHKKGYKLDSTPGMDPIYVP